MHPCEDLTLLVLASYLQLVPLLEPCQKLIMCDAPKRVREGGEARFKSGIVEEVQEQRYLQYIERLERLCVAEEWPFVRTRVVRMPSYSGFSMCVKAGLQQLTAQGLSVTLVLQHDRPLRTTFDVWDIVRSMAANKRLRYIKLREVLSQIGYSQQLPLQSCYKVVAWHQQEALVSACTSRCIHSEAHDQHVEVAFHLHAGRQRASGHAFYVRLVAFCRCSVVSRGCVWLACISQCAARCWRISVADRRLH
jgi:acetolactate synthase regulatory subunit